MAQNVSYASGDTILESLVLHTLPDFGGPTSSGIINNNFLLALLKEKKRMKIIDGGLEFWKGVRKSENSNAKWQGHTDTMKTDLQDPTARLRWDIMTFTDSIVINKKHEAMNKGRAMMKNFAKELTDQAEDTIPNAFNGAFWNTAPGALEPSSVPSLITTTPLVGTIGGLTRAGNAYLQNESEGTVVSMGAQAGVTYLKNRQIRNAISANDMIDIFIMSDSLYASLSGYLQSQRQYMPDTSKAMLDFDTIKLGKTTVSFENTNVAGGWNTISAGYIYGINSKYMSFDVLKDGNFIWNPDGFERVGQTLNKALYFWVFCNLTTNLPKAHSVATAATV